MNEVRILGGSPRFDGSPQVLDSKTKQDPVTPEIRVHEETITQDDALRREPKQEGEPEVRVRDSEAKQSDFRKALEDDA